MTSHIAGMIADHARERAAERIGRDLTDHEWLMVVWAILFREAVVVADSHLGRVVYAVALGAVVLRVVWCPLHCVVVTVLPERDREGRRVGTMPVGAGC